MKKEENRFGDETGKTPNSPKKNTKQKIVKSSTTTNATENLVKEILPTLQSGETYTLDVLTAIGAQNFIEKDYNTCVESVPQPKSSVLTIPEKALLGAESLAQQLVNNAIASKILVITPEGVRINKTKAHTIFPKKDSEPYDEATSPQLWGNIANYGGMVEWEGWEYAPLKTRDLVHVRLVKSLPLATLRARFPGWEVSESPEGTVIITGKPGDPVKDAVMEWLNNEKIAYESVRVAKKVRRRNLQELPPQFLHDLLERTVPLAYSTIVKKHRASMEILTGSQDDTKAWVSLWVTEFATMFDAEKGRPFAAWAQIQIKHKVQDLNRAINGRTASDLEIRLARAHETLESKLGRVPTAEELSQELKISGEELKHKKSFLGQMKAIRGAAPIDTGPDFADLPVIDHLADPEDETVKLETRQMVTLALLNAVGAVDPSGKETQLELPLGFVATYLMEWDDWVKSDLVYVGGGKIASKLNKEIGLVKESLKNQLSTMKNSNVI